MELTISST